ncbi:MAG: HEAT repeat domain-containing protein [Sedimentisphaerales bacterium]
MNRSSAPSKKTFYLAILSVLAIEILASCTDVQKREDTKRKQNSAFETVEKMRGLSMQLRPNARPWHLDHIRREEIMAEFHRIGKEAIPAIASALKDSDVQMRRNATEVLMELAGGWTGKPVVYIRAAIPSLISAIEDPDKDVRIVAANALAAIGPDAREAVPALTRMLKDPELGPRCASAIALGRIGVAAKPALPALREALKDPDYEIRRMSKWVIELIEKACAQDDQGN